MTDDKNSQNDIISNDKQKLLKIMNLKMKNMEKLMIMGIIL